MNKLFVANLLRIRKNKCFVCCMLLMALVGVMFPCMSYLEGKQVGSVVHLEDSFFVCIFFISILLAIFCSLFVGREYSDGTIRNKIIVGHLRKEIYLVNLFTNMMVALLLLGIFLLMYLCVGIPLFGFFESDIFVIMQLICVTLVLIFTYTSLYTMVTMLCMSKALSAIICVMFSFMMVFVGAYLNTRLQEPETYATYQTNDQGVVVSKETVKNLNYLEGTSRCIYQFFYDFLPGGQLVQCILLEVRQPLVLMGYSTLLLITSMGIGLTVFHRKDLM